jgi:putative membrane protein
MIIKTCKILAASLLLASTAIASHAPMQAPPSAQALGVLIVLNNNEIAAGHLAEAKSHNPNVKKFAALMIKEHGKNLQKTEKLSHSLQITPAHNVIAMKLKAQGMKEAAMLNKLQAASFDKAYINAMVKGHENALVLVAKLQMKAADPKVKKHLAMTEEHIKKHLQKAIAVQKTL